MIVAVVMRPKQLLGLIDQTLVVIPNILRSLERGSTVGGDIHLGEWILGKRHYFQKFSSDQRRVNECGQRRKAEMNLVPALAGNGKGRAKLPSLGNLQRCRVVDVVGSVALGIQQDLIPTDDCQFVSGRRTGRESALEGSGREKVEVGLHLRDSRRNLDVNGEPV